MFILNAEGDLIDYLISLNIRPVTISYEYDPCDNLKIQELLNKAENKEYVKSKNEDDMHMMLGIQGQKGDVHIQFCQSINDKLDGLRDIKNRNQLLKTVSTIVDAEIYTNYKFWNSNYVAYDLLHNTDKYIAKYRSGGKEEFVSRMNERLVNFKGNELAEEIFLKMYANPIINAEKVKEGLV